MPVPFTAVGKSNPVQPSAPLQYYPRAIQSKSIDLEEITQQISNSTTLTETDCQAVIYSLVNVISKELENGSIVKLGHLGTFQVSLKGTPSATPEAVTAKNIKSASIVYRPTLRLKKIIKNLTFVRKR